MFGQVNGAFTEKWAAANFLTIFSGKTSDFGESYKKSLSFFAEQYKFNNCG